MTKDMKRPFESIKDIPFVFQEALAERVGDIDEINNMSKEDIVREKFGWELGDPRWYDTIKNWIEKAGLKIVDND